jgi:hypothetical protein
MKQRRKKPSFGGGLVVVGGQCRKVGKTSLVVDLIRAFPRARWTAVKITPYTDGGCPVRGSRCKCAPNRHTFAIREEKDRSGESDTSRFLVAGAERALWVQSKEGRVTDALALLATKLSKAGNVIVESDSLTKLWKPDLYLIVLDSRRDDFKASARSALRVADAFVRRSPADGSRARKAARGGSVSFLQPLGRRLPEGLQRFVMRRLGAGKHLT